MDSLFNKNSEEREHPSREALLLFVDGELASKDASHLETHLEACWPCRVKTQRIQEAISDIIEFDEAVLTTRLLPPHDWRNFNRQLHLLAAESGNQSWLARFVITVGRFLPVVRFLSSDNSAAQVSSNPMLPARGRSIPPARSFSDNASHLWRWFFGTPLRFTGTAVLIGVIAALLLLFRHEPVVSAGELLHKAAEAESARIRAVPQPVIHQRLQLRRKTQAHEETVSWETWSDTVNSRFVQRCSGCATQTALKTKSEVASPGIQDPLLAELNAVLVANQMDPQRTLSAPSYQSWHNTVRLQRDEVIRTKLSDGTNALTLRTVAALPLNVGQISEAVFIVRARDWRPNELRLTVQTADGDRVYDLTETASEVISLSQIDPATFAGPTASLLTTSTKSGASASELETRDPNPESEGPAAPPAVSASAEIEIEALRLLQQAGADLGEQITVKRGNDGLLHIFGLVETDKRKAEIRSALSSIAGDPAVRIEIQTVAEAVAAQRQTKPTPLPKERAVQIHGNTMAAEPMLRAYFTGRSNDVDQAVRQYAGRMVSLSNRGMDHLWAMKRLLGQFSPEELRALTPEARGKWLGLVRAHAHSFQQTNQSLRRELQPIFFPSQSLAGISSEGTLTDTNEISRAIEQLFNLGAANDRVIRSAFTSSSSAATTTVVQAPQFWESLRNAEAMAARIGQ